MLRSKFTQSRPMSATFEIRAASLKGALRQAHGEAARVAFARRRELINATIYNRPAARNASRRRLTGVLRASESIAFAGDRVILTNTAKYANIRHSRRGISKLFGHRLDSFWAARAMTETRATRLQIFADATNGVWRKGAAR